MIGVRCAECGVRIEEGQNPEARLRLRLAAWEIVVIDPDLTIRNPQ